jgi:hypothetical protein
VKSSSYYLKSFLKHHHPPMIEKYILEHSSSDQSVLVWGLRPDLNFTTGRRSPTRFIFLLHLFSPTSKGPNGFDEFLDGIKADPPAVITVDTNSVLLPFFGAEGDLRCQIDG